MVIAANQNPMSHQAQYKLDRRLGELLLNNGTLTEQQIKHVLGAEREYGERLSDVAVRLGLVTERDMRRALARQCEVSTILPDVATLNSQLVVAHAPTSARSEALRSLRSELLLRWFSRSHGALAIGEARRHHGADVLAANLAWTCAQLGQRTLLIDANLRCPQQHKLFKLAGSAGLAEFLDGRCAAEDILRPVPGLAPLSVMFAGKPPPNPQELLSLESFKYLLETMHQEFDTILVTGAPMLECADMQTIAACAGGCMVVAKRHHTQMEDLDLIKSYLAPTNTTLVGVVIEG